MVDTVCYRCKTPKNVFKKNNNGSGEMLNNKVNAHGGFTPAAMASLNAITPEQVLGHHRIVQGRYGGTGTVPSVIVPVSYISYHSKGILQN